VRIVKLRKSIGISRLFSDSYMQFYNIFSWYCKNYYN